MTRDEYAQTIDLLTRTPAALNALVRGLPDALVRATEGGDSWSVFDVVGHLAYAERDDWIPRARRIMEHGESRAFDPFDRQAQFRESEGKSIGQLLDEFARDRAASLDALRAMNVKDGDLGRRGKHPSLGAVTLGQLLATWGAHDMTHLHQISRIIAHQYRDAVGPWNIYLGVMKCAGHSE